MTRADNILGANKISLKNIISAVVDLVRHPKISPHIQMDTTAPVDAKGDPMRTSNIYSGSVAQWMVSDVRETSGNPNAIHMHVATCT